MEDKEAQHAAVVVEIVVLSNSLSGVVRRLLTGEEITIASREEGAELTEVELNLLKVQPTKHSLHLIRVNI